jgi:glycine oxidase
MPERADVLIVGGGVIGLTTAYFLAARFDVRVTVLDRGPLGREASWAGAGIVPPGTPERAGTPMAQLRAMSSSMMYPLSTELGEVTGIDNGYRISGGIEFPGNEPIDTTEWSNEGIEWRLVDGEELRGIEPALAIDRGPAFFLPQVAQIRNPRHLRALIEASEARGVRLRPGCPVTGLEQSGGRINAVRTGEGRIVADQYLFSAGAWTDSLLAPLGCEIGSRPVRGQIVLLRTASPVLHRIVEFGRRYLVPRDDGRVLIGSTEEDAGFDATTTSEAIAELLRFGADLAPVLGRATVEKCWAGLRPGSPDGLPTLGRAPGFDNLWVAAGHLRAGLQLSPATGLVMAEALTGRIPSIPLDAFRPGRPRAPQPRPAFRS